MQISVVEEKKKEASPKSNEETKKPNETDKFPHIGQINPSGKIPDMKDVSADEVQVTINFYMLPGCIFLYRICLLLPLPWVSITYFQFICGHYVDPSAYFHNIFQIICGHHWDPSACFHFIHILKGCFDWYVSYIFDVHFDSHNYHLWNTCSVVVLPRRHVCNNQISSSWKGQKEGLK